MLPLDLSGFARGTAHLKAFTGMKKGEKAALMERLFSDADYCVFQGMMGVHSN